MPATDYFSVSRFPQIAEGKITCIGLMLDSDLNFWSEAVQPLVTSKERLAANRFVHKGDAIRHLVGRAIVRGVITGINSQLKIRDFSFSGFGKPFEADSDIQFSISHSGEMVWTAFCRESPVGIDVEKIISIQEIFELAEIFHPEECAAIREQLPNNINAFYRCWTRKEAILKATGLGLNSPLDSFQVQTEPNTENWLISLPEINTMSCHVKNEKEWTTQDIKTHTEYQCSVAALMAGLEVKTFLLN